MTYFRAGVLRNEESTLQNSFLAWHLEQAFGNVSLESHLSCHLSGVLEIDVYQGVLDVKYLCLLTFGASAYWPRARGD